MGKKNKGSNAGCLLLIIFIVSIIFTPILLFLGTIISFLQLQSIAKRLAGTLSDFWLNDVEQAQYENYINKIAGINSNIDTLVNEGNNAGISKNNDGSFSRRSNLGKEIQGKLEELNELKNKLEPNVNTLAKLPLKRWNTLNAKARMYKSCFTGLIAWVLSLSAMSVYYDKSGIVEAIKPYYAICHNIFSDMDHRIQLQDGDISITLINTAVGILTFICCYFIIYTNAGAKYSPMPCGVNPNNYDKYNNSNNDKSFEATIKNDETENRAEKSKTLRPKWEIYLIRFLSFMVLLVIAMVIFAIISNK